MKSVSSSNFNQIKSLKILSSIEKIFFNILPPDQANAQSLVFISTSDQLATAINNKVLGFIILEKIFSSVENLIPKNSFFCTTPNIHWAMSDVLTFFDKNILIDAKIHPTAVIHSKAQIGKNVTIGAFAVIGDAVIIQDHVFIGPHCVIEHHSLIKQSAFLTAQVFIGSYSEIGERSKLGPHVVIGSDGFGFFTDKNFNHHKISQIGNVVLEDDVELGAHCAIDRATLTETRIQRGSKFDNHCHVAHNCEIGENAAVAAGFIVAGSTKIGKNFMSSGGVGVIGHLKITDNVILTARTGVMTSIEKSGIYGGYPNIEQKENLKIMATTQQLPKMRKQISAILKHLGLEI